MPDVTALSLRARLAIALNLFAAYCERRGLHHPEIAAYLDYLWRFIGMPTTTEEFARWQEDEPPLVRAGLGWEYPPGFETFLAGCGVAESEFRGALGPTTEVLFGSMYGAADESGSKRYISELAQAVAHWGIRWPNLTPFSSSRWLDGSGWGAIPTEAELEAWRVGSEA